MLRCHEQINKIIDSYDVDISGTILKPNMVTPGLDHVHTTVEEVAQATVKCLNVPAELPGIAFLSGGQTEMNQLNILI